MIHPTALISSEAELHETVKVGPYVVVDGEVEIGEGTVIGPHVHLTGRTKIGKNNVIHTAAVIGGAPQDMKYCGEPTGIRIGNNNNIREHVTLHRSNTPEEDTVIGAGNFFMAHSHVGHNAQVGNENIFANGALLGGHTKVADKVFLSGNCAVHQYVRIGELAMMQGNAAISQDLPPYTMVYGVNKLCGLNIIGLRRAGFTAEQRQELHYHYKRIFIEGNNVGKTVREALDQSPGDKARRLLQFIAESERGVCSHASRKH
jgi:UDP-N-acetylglucosamine acyltransferase